MTSEWLKSLGYDEHGFQSFAHLKNTKGYAADFKPLLKGFFETVRKEVLPHPAVKAFDLKVQYGKMLAQDSDYKNGIFRWVISINNPAHLTAWHSSWQACVNNCLFELDEILLCVSK